MLKNAKRFIRVNGRIIPIYKKKELYKPKVPYKKKSDLKVSKYKTDQGHMYWLEKKGQRIGVANVSPAGSPNVKDLENIEIGKGFQGKGYGKEFYKKIFAQEKLAGTKYIRGDIQNPAALNIRSRYNTKFLLREKNGMEPTKIVNYSEAAAGLHRQKKINATHDVLATTKLDYPTTKPDPIIKTYEKLKKTRAKPQRKITSRKIARSQFLRGEPVRRLWGQRGVGNVYQTKTMNIGKNRIEVKPPSNLRDFTRTLDQIIDSMNKTKGKRFIHIRLPKWDTYHNHNVVKSLQQYPYAKKVKLDPYREGKIIIDSKNYRKAF